MFRCVQSSLRHRHLTDPPAPSPNPIFLIPAGIRPRIIRRPALAGVVGRGTQYGGPGAGAGPALCPAVRRQSDLHKSTNALRRPASAAQSWASWRCARCTARVVVPPRMQASPVSSSVPMRGAHALSVERSVTIGVAVGVVVAGEQSVRAQSASMTH